MRRGMVLICLLLFPASTWTQNVDVYGLYGFDSAVMANRWNPLTLYISNLPALPELAVTVSATIDPVARPDRTVYSVVNTVYPSSDGTATVRTIVPVGRFPLPVEVSALDSRWTVNPAQWNAPERLVVAITDPDTPFSPFPGADGNETARPVMETLPDHPLGYDAADALIVWATHFERATAAQIRALTHAVEWETTVPVPIVGARRNDTDAIGNILLSQPVYRFPSRWILLVVLGTYLGALAVLGRSGSVLTFTAMPLGLSLLFLVVYAVVDPPPAEVHVEVQRVEGVAGESGALLVRDVLAMSIHGNSREVAIPPESVLLPRPGEQVTVTGDRYIPTAGRWSSDHFSTAEIIPNPYGSTPERRGGITVRIDPAGIHYLNAADEGKDAAADRIFRYFLGEYGNEGAGAVEVVVSDGVVDPLATTPPADRVGVRSVSVFHLETEG